MKDPTDAALRARVGALLKKLAADPANGILTVWSEQELREADADPRASSASTCATASIPLPAPTCR